MRSYSLLTLLSLLAACDHAPQSSSHVPPANTAPPPARKALNDPPAPQRGMDTLRFAAGADSAVMEGTWNAERHDSLFLFEVIRPAALYVQLVPGKPTLNLRINQVLLPDGSADGPFGSQLRYSLKQKGWHALRIGPNRMAEGDTAGSFRLTLHIR